MEQNDNKHNKEKERINRLVAKFEANLTDDGKVNTWFDSEDIEDICNHYLDKGKMKLAERAVAVGMSLHPKDETMQLLHAHVLIEEYKPQEALELLDSMHLTDDFYHSYLRLGALADLGRWQDAVAAADNAMKQDSDVLAAAMDVAHVFYDRGQTDTALLYLLRAEKEVPDDKELTELILQCYADLGQTDTALTYVDKLIDADPYNIDAWQTKAALHVDKEAYQQALEDFEYAIAINPESETTLISKAKLLMLMNRLDDALAVIDEIEGISNMWHGVCMMLRGDVQFMIGDMHKAHTYYYKGFSRKMCLYDSTMRYMECKMRLAKWDGAVSIGNHLLNMTPDDKKLLEMLSDAYFEIKRYDMSARMLRRCLRLEPDNVYMLLRYGTLMLDMQDTKKAYTAIHRAYRISPEISYTNLLMAVVCYVKSEYKRMYHYYRNACKADPASKKTFISICPDVEQYIESLDALTKKCEEKGITNIDKILFKKK